MPYGNLEDGLYLIVKKSREKGVDHYGVLDVGNRLNLIEARLSAQPVVIHQTPPSIRIDWLGNTGEGWTVQMRVTDEAAAITRIREAARTPGYDLFGHNCEHFARFVTQGRRESSQLQAAAVMGIAGLTLAALAARG